ncbi:hypothetical protein ACUY3S_09130 [Corynebacterium resistens]
MTGSVLTLLIGLAFLGLAIWLLWRAGTQGTAGTGSAASSSTPTGIPDADALQDREDRGVEIEKLPEQTVSETTPAPAASAPGACEDEPAPTALETLPEQQAPAADEQPSEPPLISGDSIESTKVDEGLRFIRGRKRRRAWAQDNGFEHLREDRKAAQELPEALLNAMQPEQLVLRDVVAGFFEGYEVVFGDLAGATVLRMRRPALSPVTVYYSVAGAVPAGMRRAELLDQPPYYGFTTDIRALDRMLDERVEDGLAALAHVVSDVIWENDWVVVRMSRKLDMSVWDQVLPVVRTLADAAMVLPPLIMSTPLAMDSADPTRAWPGVSALTAGAAKATETAAEDTVEKPKKAKSGKARPGHLRAVEDKHDPNAQRHADRAGSIDESAKKESAEGDPDDSATKRPYIERPAGPVEFPSRSTGRTEGDWEGEDFPLHDETEGSIPSLGEDPDHISGSHSQYARVIRVEQETAIFGDELSHAAQMRRRKGRHRAPDARHARPEPIEPIEAEIETVDGEIVEGDE